MRKVNSIQAFIWSENGGCIDDGIRPIRLDSEISDDAVEVRRLKRVALEWKVAAGKARADLNMEILWHSVCIGTEQ